MIDVVLPVFVTLFVTIDPVGLTPIFVALTRGIDRGQRNLIALRACGIAIVLLAIFGLAGDVLLRLVGIGLPAFRIAGGLLLFLIAVEMLFERRTGRREKAADASDPEAHDPSVFPLATPLLAGPGALASMILLMGERTGDWGAQALVLVTMMLVVATAYVLFRLSGFLERVLGQIGTTVVTRLLGMLLAALAVQFVVDGLMDIGLIESAPQ